MRESGCYEKFMALNRGRVIRANIEKLIAHFRSEGNLSDPYASGNYITWLRDQVIQQSQASVAPTGESGAVTLATVHASKGREWPLVALADLNSGDPTGGSDRILWSEKNGISFTWLDPSSIPPTAAVIGAPAWLRFSKRGSVIRSTIRPGMRRKT